MKSGELEDGISPGVIPLGITKNPIYANYKHLNKNRNVKYSCILKKGKNSLIDNEKFMRKTNNSINILHKILPTQENKNIVENKYLAQRRIYITPETKRSSKRINIIDEKSPNKHSNTNNITEKISYNNSNNTSSLNNFTSQAHTPNISISNGISLLNLELMSKLNLQKITERSSINSVRNTPGTRNPIPSIAMKIGNTTTGGEGNNPSIKLPVNNSNQVKHYTKIKLAPINLKHSVNNNSNMTFMNLSKYHTNSNHTTGVSTTSNSVNTTDRIQKKNLLQNSNNISVNKSYSAKSKVGVSIKNPTVKKVNQDSYLALPTVLELENYSIFSVFDGHGINGHFISDMVKTYFSKFFAKSELYYIPRKNSQLQTGLPSLKGLIEEQEIYKKLVEDDYSLIKSAFKMVEKEIEESNHDVDFSGTTACTVIIVGDKVICANVGDSRGIIVSNSSEYNYHSYNSNSSQLNILNILQISNDHKPELHSEKERILSRGGAVEKINEYGVKLGPYRVWVKGESYPGLAMSRSLGDFVSKSIGVTPEPEILEFNINSNTKFIVLASDGVWEYMSNEAVADITNKYYKINDVSSAVDELVKEATNCWINEEKNIDDITVIIIFFH